MKLKGNYIEVNATDKASAKQLVDDWYLQNAKSKFRTIAQSLKDNFKKYNIEPSSIVLRNMPPDREVVPQKAKLF